MTEKFGGCVPVRDMNGSEKKKEKETRRKTPIGTRKRQIRSV